VQVANPSHPGARGQTDVEIYDALIAEVPLDLRVEECLIGMHWMIRTHATEWHDSFERGRSHAAQYRASAGKFGVYRASCRVHKIWDPFEASLGLHHKPGGNARTDRSADPALSTQPQESAFMHYLEAVRGKKVARSAVPDLGDEQNLQTHSVGTESGDEPA
jgi:hypothetical protein